MIDYQTSRVNNEPVISYWDIYDSLKTSNITLSFKKRKRDILSNYRLILILTSISTAFIKTIHIQLYRLNELMNEWLFIPIHMCERTVKLPENLKLITRFTGVTL